jgi:hypothetical protein
VVSISTTRVTPRPFGLSHFAGAGAGAAAGAGAGDAFGAGASAGEFWAQAAVAVDIEIARAIAKTLRITFSMIGRCPYSGILIDSSRL